MANTVSTTPVTDQTRIARRVWLSSFIGATIEFYDFAIYVAASALVFGPLFFGKADPEIATVLSFMTLAIGYAARPIGAIVFGHFGDRIGRKSVLITTLIMMGVSTFLIGCLPTGDQIGNLAPVLLIILRLLQGIAVGGEWGGAVTMTTEYSSAKKRGFAGSATNSGASIGFALGFGTFALVSLLTGDALTTYGWRIPFWVTIALFVIAMYIRTKIDESPVMKAQLEKGMPDTPPIVDVLKKNWRQVVLGTAIVAGVFSTSQFMNTFLVNYSTTKLGHSSQFMLWLTTSYLVILAVLVPLSAVLGDRIGRRRLMLIGTAAMIVYGVIVWPLMHGGLATVIVAYLLYAFVYALSYGPQAAVLTELFPTATRYTGISLAYQFGALIAGFVPLVYSLFIARGLGEVAVAVVFVALLVVTYIAVLRLRQSDSAELTEVGQ